MKHLLAAATFAALLAATPAGAQVAYGMSPSSNAGGAGTTSVGNWRDAVVIYASGNTGSSVINDAIAPLAGDAGSVGGVSFDVRDAAAGTNLTGFAGGADAVTPVPEPAIWAMMMLGFAAMGGALRGRKATIRYA